MKLNRNDFVYIYSLKIVDILKRNRIKPIIVARNKGDGEVFSMYFKSYEVVTLLEKFDELEKDRLKRIEFYKDREKRLKENENV